jgi:acyl carrier protein
VIELRSEPVEEKIWEILMAQGRLPANAMDLGDHVNLFQIGLTSHANVNVMLALEEEFDVEFPESMLRKSTFESVSAIRAALDVLLATTNA